MKKAWPSLMVAALLIALWWILVVESHSVIFPTPWSW
jgi:hypothetical protein